MAAKTFNNKTGSITIDSKIPEPKTTHEDLGITALMNSKTQNQPIEITITGIEPVKLNRDAAPVMMPVSMYHGYKIIIPREHFIPIESYGEDIKTEEDLTKRIFRYNSAKVDIIPQSFIPASKVCVASRIEAMKIKKDEMWFALNRKADGTTEYLLQPGSKVEARVINAVRGAVFIEIFGVESAVLAKNVAWYRIDNCRNKYKSGDTVFVILNNVIRDEELKTVTYEASIKDAYPDPRDNAFARYVRGGVYEGRVTMLNTNPEITDRSGAFVRLGRDEEDKIDVYCNYPKGVLPIIGDYVTVGIQDKDPNTKRIWGNILHIERQHEIH